MFRSYNDIERPSPSADLSPERPAPRLYVCDWCSDGWESESEVHIHMIREHDIELCGMLKKNDETICRMCVTKFDDRETVQKHIRRDHLLSSEDARRVEREIFICDACSQIFFNKQMLVVHMAQIHKNRRKKSHVACPKCSRNIRLDAMWAHFEHHRVQSVSSCPVCLVKCQDRADLRRHLSSHSRQYYCELCMYLAKKADNFHQHVDRHREVQVATKSVSDQLLKRCFVAQDDIRLSKLKINAFKGLTLSSQVKICVLCREICTNKLRMKQHIMHHTTREKETKKLHVCSCGAVFCNRILLKQHAFKTGHRALDEGAPQTFIEIVVENVK